MKKELGEYFHYVIDELIKEFIKTGVKIIYTKDVIEYYARVKNISSKFIMKCLRTYKSSYVWTSEQQNYIMMYYMGNPVTSKTHFIAMNRNLKKLILQLKEIGYKYYEISDFFRRYN